VAHLSRWPAIILSAAFLMLLFAGIFADPASSSTPPIAAIDSHLQKMTYQVYAGGINAVTAELDVAYEAKDRYRLSLAAHTRGLLGKLVPWSGLFETKGWRSAEGIDTPELHRSSAIWRNEEEIKEYNYGADGSFKSLRVIEEGKDTSKKIDDELTQGTIDALTAALEVMEHIAEGGGCEGRSEVFDGARRFALIFVHEAEEIMEATSYNAYNGPAVRCSVEVKPISGKWHTKPRGWLSIQEQGRDKGTLPTLWLAKIDKTGPAVPVKMRVKTDYGTLFMHMIGYKNGVKEFSTKDD